MIGALLASTLAISPAWAQPGPLPKGYLPPGAVDLTRILPPPPVMNGPHQLADQALFKATRQMKGTPRYALATTDASMTPDAILDRFSCAAGLQLTPKAVPKLMALTTRMTGDTMGPMIKAKEVFGRVRPAQIDKGEVCEGESQSHSLDYPSGHAVLGWSWAMILAELIPDRATELLVQGRTYGESRIICGSHSAAAVEAGQLTATAVITRLQASPEFRADLEAARAEMTQLRAAGVPKDPAACAIEDKALSTPVPR